MVAADESGRVALQVLSNATRRRNTALTAAALSASCAESTIREAAPMFNDQDVETIADLLYGRDTEVSMV